MQLNDGYTIGFLPFSNWLRNYSSEKFQYQKERFRIIINPKPEQIRRLRCAQCHDILVKPHKGHCGCRFCSECVIYYKDKCPGCSITLIGRTDDIITADEEIDKEILELDVRCLHEACDHQCKLKDLNRHLKVCKYMEDGMLCVKDQALDAESDYYTVDNAANNCQSELFECPMKDVGCDVVLPRGEMDLHCKDMGHHMTLLIGELVKIKEENNKMKCEHLEIKSQISEFEFKLLNDATQISALKMEQSNLKTKFNVDNDSMGTHGFTFKNLSKRMRDSKLKKTSNLDYFADSSTMPGCTMHFFLYRNETNNTMTISMKVSRSKDEDGGDDVDTVVGIKWRQCDVIEDNNYGYLSPLSPGSVLNIGNLTMDLREISKYCNANDELPFIVEILAVPVSESNQH